MKTHWLSRGILLSGLLCLAPIACLDWVSRPTSEDAFTAMRPIVQIPLESLREIGESSILFEVPSAKMTRYWGNPTYAVFWKSSEGNLDMIHAFSMLQLQVKVFVNNLPALLNKAAGSPYGYSSDTSSIGDSFNANPRDTVRIEFRALNPKALPDGVLVVSPEWDLPIKDRLVSIDLDHYFYRIARVMAWIGMGLLSIACIRSFVGSGK